MLQHNKMAALYCRLSRDDRNTGDSDSIQNQEMMLTQYAKVNGFQIVDTYKDDGFTGTNFERPDFIRMMADLRTKKADTVIVKDLSRFGREHIQADLYREIEFPQMGVRLIAINDSYDSAKTDHSSNSMAQIKGLFNEWFAADTSEKVRRVLRAKAEAGQYIGNTPYGYAKDANDKHKLIPDEVTAPIVRRIFDLAIAGNGYRKIARVLTDEQILCPGEHSGRKSKKAWRLPYEWNYTTVRTIIENQVYLGHSVQCRTTKLSHKVNKTLALPENQWIRVENTHEPLVSQSIWDMAQSACETRTRSTKTGEPHIFAGLLRCGDCDSRMAKGDKESFSCQRYKLYGKNTCTSHYVSGKRLSAAVLASIKDVSETVRRDRKGFVKRFSAITDQQRKYRTTTMTKECGEVEKRLAQLPGLIKSAFEQNASGILTDDIYAEIVNGYKAEREALTAKLDNLTAAIAKVQSDSEGLNEFLALIERYANIKELDSAIVHELIEKIAVYQSEAVDGKKAQQIDIYYRFIGKI